MGRSSWLLIALLAACNDSGPGSADLGPDRGGDDSAAVDVATEAASPDGAADAPGVDTLAPDLGADARLVVEQIGLDGMMGEAALVLGPDGTSVLIDCGGAGHAKKILEAIDRRVGKRTLDWIIVTHYHYDHVGSFVDLVTPSAANGNNPVQVTRGVISRGLYDVDGELAGTTASFVSYCNETAKPAWTGKLFDLCSGPAKAPCDGQGSGDPWPASGCPGLQLGDLLDSSDDNAGAVSWLSLGGGAKLYLFQANGHVATKQGVISAAQDGVNLGHGGTAPENARSLGGVIRWGSFIYTFHGDTTGDVEGVVAKHAAEITTSPQGGLLVPTSGLDVTHLSHHGLEGSTSQTWVDWLLPADGRDRNAVIGANGGYLISPAPGVLSRVGARVSGGYMWLTFPAALGGTHPRLRLASGAVVLEVKAGGASYDMSALNANGTTLLESYTSTAP